MQQEILARNASPNLQVYAIWFNMLPGDSRAEWDGAGLMDQRVTHLWDESRLAGDWFGAHVTHSGRTEWDAYFLYGPEARWGSEPAPLVSWGATLVGKEAQLKSSIMPLLGR